MNEDYRDPDAHPLEADEAETPEGADPDKTPLEMTGGDPFVDPDMNPLDDKGSVGEIIETFKRLSIDGALCEFEGIEFKRIGDDVLARFPRCEWNDVRDMGGSHRIMVEVLRRAGRDK